MSLLRREFLGCLAAGAASAATTSFTFAHVTDLHIQPEMRAAEGCRQCLTAVNAAKPDLVITGGDLIFDALATPKARAQSLFSLYKETIGRVEAPVHNVVGNHDVYGVFPQSGASPSDPDYGKKMYEDLIGRRYYSFNHKGWHFVILDSIGITPERGYVGDIDEEQMDWLRQDLASTGTRTPIVAVTHIPLSTGFGPWLASPQGVVPPTLVVARARPVLELLHRYNIKAVLQGHTHICENLHYRGCQYITSGSVCGEWWKGPRLGVHPEGFGLLTVEGDSIRWDYRTYGFRAAA